MSRLSLFLAFVVAVAACAEVVDRDNQIPKDTGYSGGAESDSDSDGDSDSDSDSDGDSDGDSDSDSDGDGDSDGDIDAGEVDSETEQATDTATATDTAIDTEFLVTCEHTCGSLDDCEEGNGKLLFGDDNYCGDSVYCCELPSVETDDDTDDDPKPTDTGQGVTCKFDCISQFGGELCAGSILSGPSNQCGNNEQCCDPDTPAPACDKECLGFQDCDFTTFVQGTECDNQGQACCDRAALDTGADTGPPVNDTDIGQSTDTFTF